MHSCTRRTVTAPDAGLRRARPSRRSLVSSGKSSRSRRAWTTSPSSERTTSTTRGAGRVRILPVLCGAERRLGARLHGVVGRHSDHPSDAPHIRRLQGSLVRDHRRPAAIRRARHITVPREAGILSDLFHEEEAEAWVRAHVEPVGGMELVHERPWGTVRRLPVAGGVAWFKECAPAQAFEPGLTAALAGRWSDRVPDVLGYDDEHAWLLLGDAGEPLGFDGGPEPWMSVLPRYAELQHGEAAHAAEHLDGGVPDRRIATFPALYETMLARELPLRRGDLARLRAFAPRFAELSDELAAQGIPETIQHDDLHGANVYPRGGTPRILDWGDSCVSHPFVTLFVTFLHLDEVGARDSAWYASLRDA